MSTKDNVNSTPPKQENITNDEEQKSSQSHNLKKRLLIDLNTTNDEEPTAKKRKLIHSLHRPNHTKTQQDIAHNYSLINSGANIGDKKEMKMHLIWKGKILHNEVMEDNMNGDQRMFGMNIYQIGGDSYIYRLPGFEVYDLDNKKKKKLQNKNIMLMTGRIAHSELEKYLLKSFSNESRKLICCKITISKAIGEAQKLIKHYKEKERCARFKMGSKNKKDYFDFYIIPPTSSNKYLNSQFVENNFNAKISNKKMWGVIILPIYSLNKVNNNLYEKDQENNNINNNNKRGNNDSSQKYNLTTESCLHDAFFTNLNGLADLLGVDTKIKHRYLSSKWQVLTDDYKWKTLSDENIMKLDGSILNGTVKYSVNNYKYRVQKIGNDEAIQMNDSTKTKRDIRRILYDGTNKKRVVWQFMDDKGGWSRFDDIDLMLNISILSKGEMHEYSRGTFKYRIMKIDESQAKQINIKTQKIRECRMIKKNLDDMDPNWISNGNSTSPQKPILNDMNTNNIYKKFCETWKNDKVDVICICKINNKALCSRTNAYNEFLKGKKEELKYKNIKDVERVLFHGTSFENVESIINNGFNRDFNRNHRYGKGSYFSNRADISQGYCTKNDKGEYVILICRVIIGEFAKGKKDMDGSNWPIKSDKKTPFESCVNNIESPKIFVINNDSHAVPTHMITFKYIK